MEYSYQLTKEDWKSINSLVTNTYHTIERGKKVATIFLIVYGFSYTLYCLWNKQYSAACLFVILILTMYGIFIYACREDIMERFNNRLCFKWMLKMIQYN